MKHKSAAVLVIFFVLFSGGSSWAHHAPGAAVTGHTGPVLTSSASPLQKGQTAITLLSSYTDINFFSDSEMLDYASQGNDVHTFDYLYTISAVVAYGITDNLTLSLKIPYTSQNNIREAHSDEPDEIHQHGDARGMGDITILGQYRFLKLPSRQFETSVLFGLKVPTGKTNDKDMHGERFEAEHQPGSGSWDPILGIAATRRFGRISLDADLRYTLVTEGAQDTDLGDLMNYDLAFSYQVPGKIPLDLVMELNGEWKQKQEIRGSTDQNSGEHVLFLSPGIRAVLNRSLSAFFSIGFPLFQDMNGIQSETNYRMLFGMSFGL